MGLSVGRAAGHTRGFTHTIPDGHLDSKPQVHLWVLFPFPLGWEGCSWWCGFKEPLCMWLHCRGLWTAAGVGPRLSLTYCPDIHGLVSPGPSSLPSLVFYRVCLSKGPWFSLSSLPGNG